MALERILNRLKSLNAKHILAPDDIHSEEILNTYVAAHRWNADVDALPPAIVVRYNHDASFLSFFERKKEYGRYSEQERAKSVLKAVRSAPYLLLDGHHRLVAAEICQKTGRVFEITSDNDVEYVGEAIKKKELPDWTRKEKTLAELCKSWREYTNNQCASGPIKTIAELSQKYKAGEQ